MSRRTIVITCGALLSSCAITEDDLLPGIGAPCEVAAALCPKEHSCRPNEKGAKEGLCAPVLSYGVCEEPTYGPGRFGTVEEEIVINADGETNKLTDVRRTNGDVRIYDTAELSLEGGLCEGRTLQRVDGTLVMGNLDLTVLDGLNTLTSVGGPIAILGNRLLESLDALDQLVDIGGCSVDGEPVDMLIARNSDLTADEVDAFIVALEQRLGRTPDVIHCGNGPVGNQDGLCSVDVEAALDLLRQGEAVCD